MASGEDLVGLVQDDARNRHFLANPSGKGVFDCVVSVAGILVIGASQELIDFWGELAVVDEGNRADWIKSYNLPRKCRNLSLDKLKTEIERKATAEIENSYNFNAFMDFCGAFERFGEGDDTVFDRLWKRCPYIAYHAWWPKSQLPEDEKTWDTSKPKTRIMAVKHIQTRWFNSRTFLESEVTCVC